MAAHAQLRASLMMALTGTSILSSAPQWNGSVEVSQTFEDGTTANKIDIIYAAQRTVNSASNDDIDLAGALSSALGSTITAAEVVAIMIVNQQKDGTANTTNLTIGNGSNPYSGFVGAAAHTVGPIRPGGMFLIMNPDATGLGTVTAGTGDILRVANSSGASASYQVAILARTA